MFHFTVHKTLKKKLSIIEIWEFKKTAIAPLLFQVFRIFLFVAIIYSFKFLVEISFRSSE